MTKLPLTYIAGDMLPRSSQLLRAQEAEEVRNLGYPLYVPQENKSINDKAAHKDDEKLAERIVRHDTDALINADVIIIEPQPFALGTMAELGQLKGMLDMARMIIEIMDNEQLTNSEVVEEIDDLASKILGKKIYPHYEDIRRVDGITETGDRRSLGINQYIYGLVLDLTNGKGFYEWDEIIEELIAAKNDK